ncbi:AAA family ATPase [Tetragenococcus halophilus]|uniref:AAA family ATPase n=1 Tax=Tetragenococcus halophilus TaxID=51669 RepID=UPI000CAE09AA|nr:AAA family ATPase [Tetragenococcus halophilus]GBD61697.1 hypothetical protein TEH11_1380 [Tetragenococcus halophilus subsp. halophilus]GMG62154.1 hypothetical protein TEHAB4_19010 [Tetragenococcus halophilus]GMG69735.1 hypothetical protein TEHOK1_04240 [Tetragenococcus halophilus]
MKIEKLEIENFRQFYGKQVIEFGQGENNVTIILGANGNGKTGIFRAIMFALYGDMSLEQDNKSKETPILVNIEKLDENLSLPVEAKVILTFKHKETEYVIERQVSMIKEANNNFRTNSYQPSFYKLSESGDFEKIKEDTAMYINNILHRDLREFFFFDAEKMELLSNTRSQRKMTKEVKEGIIKLLQIKSLDDSGKLLKDLIDQENRKISNKAKDSDINEKVTLKNKLDQKLQKLEKENQLLEDNREKALKEIETYEQDLSANQKIRKLQERRNQSEQFLNESRELFNEQKKNIQHLLKEVPSLLVLDFLETKDLEFKELKDSQNDTIPLDMIEVSLQHEKCQLCQQGIPHSSITYERLKELENSYTFSDLTPVITGIQTTTQKLKREETVFKNEMDTYLQKTIQREEDIEKQELAIRKIDDEIKGKAELLDNLKNIEQNLSTHKNNVKEQEKKIDKNKIEIIDIEKNIKQLEKDIHALSLKHNELYVDSKIVGKLRTMKKVLEEITSEYTQEIIHQFSAEMTKVFHSLLSKKDKTNFEKVVINENYEISVLDKMGNNLVRELSMGQGQIFTLAFITTLAKLASKGRNEISFPLFMDTPFGRISGENRDNLIEQIPKLTNQWILLLTDTELTKVEQDAFEQHQKVGKTYELVSQDRRTEIQEKNNIMELRMRG